MGTLTIPNLEVALQQHRAAFDFSVQNDKVHDARLFAQLMNALLPVGYKIQIANMNMLLGLKKDWEIKCKYCRESNVLTPEVLRDNGNRPIELPVNIIRPLPYSHGTASKEDVLADLWGWLQEYSIRLETNISALTWRSLRGRKE